MDKRIIPDYPDKVIINVKEGDPPPRFQPAIIDSSNRTSEADKTDGYRVMRLGVPTRLEKTRIAVASAITAIGVAAGVILLTDTNNGHETHQSNQPTPSMAPPQKPETIIPAATAAPTSIIAEPIFEPEAEPLASAETEPEEEQEPTPEPSAVAALPKEATKKIPQPTRKYKKPEDIYDDFDARPEAQKPKKPVKGIPGGIVREVPF